MSSGGAAVSPRTDCAPVAFLLGLRGRGRSWHCPRAPDRPAGLHTPQGGGWQCGTCGAGGNAVELVAHVQGLDLSTRDGVRAAVAALSGDT